MTDLEWHGCLVTCPSCGEKQGDLWEYNMGDEDIKEVDCGSCDARFMLHCSVTVEYAASPIEADDARAGEGWSNG